MYEPTTGLPVENLMEKIVMEKLKIVVLDAGTLGDDLDLSPLTMGGVHELTVYKFTSAEDIEARTRGAHVAIINKLKMNATTLGDNPTLRLICVAATGYDNIDLNYCREKGIGAANVVGYSSNSVSQVTVAMALSLICRLDEYTDFVSNGSYSSSGAANRLTPVYHEIAGQTWGIVGYGNIGRRVADAARALGCRVVYTRANPDGSPDCLPLDELCRVSDIISIHTPLTDATRGMISRERIDSMKPSAIIVNVARGAVTDEGAIADAILDGRLGGFGCDVYSVEPFGDSHPFRALAGHPRVCLTPHMAWGSYEARVRCLTEIVQNIESYLAGGARSRVDIK